MDDGGKFNLKSMRLEGLSKLKVRAKTGYYAATP